MTGLFRAWRVVIISKSHKRLWWIIAIVGMFGSVVAVASYFDIPQKTNVMTVQQQRYAAECPGWVKLADEQVSTLPKQFSIASWNIYKTQNTGWNKVLEKLSRQADVIALQEARESTTQNFWRQLGWSATMLEAFSMGRQSVGVQLASAKPPLQVCGSRQREPLIRLPKSLIVGVYPLADQNNELWVISLHSINFSLQIAPYLQQLNEIARLIEQHDGPLVIAGDFNTWSKRRQQVLQEWMSKYKLIPVRFKNDKRSRFFGHALDHMFYRGLKSVRSRVITTDASDHNALLATFQTIRSNE
ncbi:endonuclease/exonuclease/phosphatase family protein [Celerinatantimonas sp. MCCC 1A17872]|uniref:endonuclease/exonuclease/phosphatase family protein n=1 Tax=Celerinatantimonas sp. MCCC 1A17872 TaxID=3177514 RepID=UPI0038CA535F